VTEAKRGLDLGAYLSFSGIVTFKKADDVRDAARHIAHSTAWLVETDSPYLAPVPNRGQPNRPGWVRSWSRGRRSGGASTSEVVERATWDNTARVFRLPDATDRVTLTRRQ